MNTQIEPIIENMYCCHWLLSSKTRNQLHSYVSVSTIGHFKNKNIDFEILQFWLGIVYWRIINEL